MSKNAKIAIFTPTYNRGDYFARLFEQLEEQTDKSFVWYIIDDGSTDNTKSIIKRLIKKSSISVKYFNKKNGGKHSAFNYFMDIVKEEYAIIALDSDDNIIKNAIKIARRDIESMNEDECGIVYVNKQENRKAHFRYDAQKLDGKSLHEAIVKNLFCTECTFVFRTDYLKKFRYPIIEGENFMTEAYLYIQMRKKMKWSNKYIEYGQALDDGLEKKIFKLYKNNPGSWKLFNMLRVENANKMLKKCKYRMLSSAFWILSRKNKAKMTIYDVIYAPFGLIVALYVVMRARKMKE